MLQAVRALREPCVRVWSAIYTTIYIEERPERKKKAVFGVTVSRRVPTWSLPFYSLRTYVGSNVVVGFYLPYVQLI